MKKKIAVIVLFCCAGFGVRSQTIQYSRETFPVRYGAQTQLVANVGGYHHILSLNAETKPSIYIFDKALRLSRRVEFDYAFYRSCKVKTLSFRNFYYLYIHADNSNRHDLWRIDGDGRIIPLSQQFQRFVDSVFRKKNVMLQLVNDNNLLCVLSHTYFEPAKSVETAVARFDQAFNLLSLDKVEWTFDLDREALEQILLRHDNLFVLKKSNDNAKDGLLQAMKVNYTNGEFTTTSFGSPSKKFSFADFRLSENDRSLFVYGVIDETPDQIWMTRESFFAELDSSLRQQVPLQLLKAPFLKNSGANFFFAQSQQAWINMHTIVRPFTEFITADTTKPGARGFDYHDYLRYAHNFGDLSGTQFSALDENLKLRADSVAKDKFSVALQPYPYAQVKWKNKSYLALLQVFNNKRRTLLLVGTDEKTSFQTVNVPVYDRYEYDLTQLQAVDGESFIVPYLDKDDMGLLKVTMGERGSIATGN